MTAPISAEEQEQLALLVHVLSGECQDADPALVRAELRFDDDTRVEVAVVIATREEDDEYSMVPIAVLVSGEVMDRLVPPEGAELVDG